MFTATLKYTRRLLKKGVADRRGTTAIAIAILTPIIVAGLAFGSEVGYWQLTQRRLQNAADTAAFAAATQLRSGLELEEMKVAALTVANGSGFNLAREDASDAERAAARGTLTLTTPPATGAYAGDDDAIHVALRASVERRFSKIFTSDPISIAVEATAQVRNPRPACVLALHPTADNAIDVTGNTDVTLTGCDVAANSISPSAIAQGGSGELETDCISTVGGVSISGTVGSSPSDDVTLNDCPEPIVNAPVTADPYRNRPAPTVPAACATNAEMKELTPSNKKIGNPLPTSGSPTGANLGKAYCISANENIHGTVNFAPGVYVIKGPGTLKVNATATLNGAGVTLYFTNGAALDLNGGAAVDLSAPTDIGNPYRGLVIFFDRNDTTDSVLNGGANFSLVGAVYGPNANITFSGNTTGSDPGECTQVIGGTVTFTGNSDFDTDCSNSGTTAIQTALSIRLVE